MKNIMVNRKFFKWKIQSAFTLIELLIVISIIGILAALITASFTASQRQARDVNRKSDLAQYRTALESFASANGGLYPYMSGDGGTPILPVCEAALTGYTNTCPQDPSSPDKWYVYYSDGPPGSGVGSPVATKYLMYVANGLEADTSTWVVCSGGTSGLVANPLDWTSIYNFCF